MGSIHLIYVFVKHFQGLGILRTNKAPYSFEVEVPSRTGGLRVRSKIMVNQTRAVDKIRLIKRVGNLPDKIMLQVNQAQKLHYDLD